jgi:predicted N-acetyltransferase YhbS
MDIFVKDTLTGAERSHLMAWRERVFPEEGRGKQWSESQQHVLAFEGEALPLAHVGFGRHSLQVGEHAMTVTGIGGVVVRPEAQGRHIPAQLFQYVHSQLGFRRFALFCPERLITYYQRHGYSPYAGTVSFMQQGVLVESRFALLIRGFELPEPAVAIHSLPW